MLIVAENMKPSFHKPLAQEIVVGHSRFVGTELKNGWFVVELLPEGRHGDPVLVMDTDIDVAWRKARELL